MADQTTNLDTILQNSSQKEVLANALFDAGSPATVLGRRASTTVGLAWGYYGGRFLVGSTPTTLANGTVVLTASATNYVECTPSTGAVTKNTSAFTSGRVPMAIVVTGTAAITNYTEARMPTFATTP